VPAVVYAMDYNSKYIADENNYKTEFNVDKNLPSPNIYWLLMDGMLGFKAMEYFFNDPQTEFISQLTERGFIINRDAQYEGLQQTMYCIPVLMCPTYYDMYFLPRLKSHDFVGNQLRKSAMLSRINNELILAFSKKGYQTSCVVKRDPNNYYFTPNVLYIDGQKIITKKKEKINITDLESIEKLSSLFTIFYSTTPLGKFYLIINELMNQYMKKKVNLTDILGLSSQSSNNKNLFFGESYQGDDKWYLSALADIMNHSGPKLVIIHDLKAHNPYIFDEQGRIIHRELFDPYNYPSQHHFTSTIIISYINFILNADPEAIIVLQSDHGLHHHETGKLLLSKYGRTDDDVRLMQNQTISAVRIPEK